MTQLACLVMSRGKQVAILSAGLEGRRDSLDSADSKGSMTNSGKAVVEVEVLRSVIFSKNSINSSEVGNRDKQEVLKEDK